VRRPTGGTETGADPSPGGELLNGHEGGLGLGWAFSEGRGRGDRGGEPVAQPGDLVLGGRD